MDDPESVVDREQARALAARINSDRRDRPVVVVSVPRASAGPWIDAVRIGAEVGDLAEIAVLAHDCAWAFTNAMPPGTQVYGGAGRVYPVGLDWVHDPHRSRLRFAYDQGQGGAATTALIADALAAALDAGLVVQRRGGPLGLVEVQGEIMGCPTASQAMARTDRGYATVRVGLAFPGVSSEQVYRPGMRVRGLLDPRSATLDVRPFLPPVADRLAELRDGTVVPVRVVAVERDRCRLAVHPGAEVEVGRAEVSSDPGDDLRDLMSVGETVRARVSRDGTGHLSLNVISAGFGPCSPALALLPGGPPWLAVPGGGATPVPSGPGPGPAPAEPSQPAPPHPAPPEPVASHPGHVPPVPAPTRSAPTRSAPVRPTPLLLARQAPAGPVPAVPPEVRPATGLPGTPAQRRGRIVRDLQLELEAARTAERAARARLREVEAELVLLERELVAREQELEAREANLQQLRAKLRHSRQRGPAAEPGPGDDARFADPEEQFRFEVYLSWTRRVPAGEKAALPLRPYTLGPAFLSSLDGLQGVDRSKVVDVVVEVLTGRAEGSAGREMHPLRSGAGGDDEVLRRDGATCWRVALQRNTPAARRLHFWRGAENIELSRVVLHDDVAP